jgi:hypothetical protein
MTEAPEGTAPEVDIDGTEPPELISDWEFRKVPPTASDVVRLLKTLPDVYGVAYADYADYVQPLPQTKKIQPLRLPNGQLPPKEYVDTWTLYMSVAGRVQMLNAAAEKNDWAVEHRPEMHPAPDCPPGFLEFAERLVYREYCVITAPGPGGEERVLGSKPGTAWVPRTGGSQAAGSNPYEKVETSARGRAIGAWGIGVLPGSGIASLEEMLGVSDNRQALAADEPTRAGGSRKSRDDLLEEMFLNSERLREVSGLDPEAHMAAVGQYLSQSLGVHRAIAADGTIDWTKVKDGQIQMVNKLFKDRLEKAAAMGEA